MTNILWQKKAKEKLGDDKKNDLKMEEKLWDLRLFWIVCGFVLVVKTLLFRCYISTDFEVHRNWMAITANVPLSKWYFNNVSKWTLDYPPFFAYFEYFLALIAEKIDNQMLTIQEEPIKDDSVRIFQRLSVVFVDVLYLASSAYISEVLVDFQVRFNHNLRMKLKFALFTVLIFNPSLIILDNIHFQYNSMLYGILLFSIAAILSGKFLFGAISFAVLLNFKHIFLYYVPAFVVFYLFEFLLPFNKKIFQRLFGLVLAVGLPIFVSFGPFYMTDGLDGLLQIKTRLFPFKRGLTHSYWAPNFWAVYNFADYVLYKLFSISKFQQICSSLKIFKCSFKTLPVYISGIVEEFDHVVLPNIQPLLTFILILVFLLPIFWIRTATKRQNLLLTMIFSAYSFFLFGWHVHEKALLMIFIPTILLAFDDIKYFDNFVLLSILTPMAQFPLIFTPIEDIIKYSLFIGSFGIFLAFFRSCYQLDFFQIISKTNLIFLTLAFVIEFYKVFIHKIIFKDQMDFLPLMMTSIFCAVGVLFSYFQFIKIVFFENLKVFMLKQKCHRTERQIIRKMMEEQENLNFDFSKIEYVAGIDISAFVFRSELAILSYSVLKFDNLKVVYTADKVIRLDQTYIPEYLAVREANFVSEFVNEHKTKFPVDVLLVDGNGRFHSRFGGLACHVAHKTGLPTIGIAKNLTIGPLKKFGFTDEEIGRFEADIHKKLDSQGSDISIKVDFLKEIRNILAVIKTASKSNSLFVSVGLGIDLESAVKIVAKCLVHSVVEPIRVSDLRSRALVTTFFEETTTVLF